ncbi:MAG TPA: hypothetical protein VF103_07420, partial [Polyangiaceae bacterium]
AYCIRHVRNDGISVLISHYCLTPCQSDDDCADDELCACDKLVQNASRFTIGFGLCISATCRTDQDCGSGSFCMTPLNPTTLLSRTGELEPFHCQSALDECHAPGTCPRPPTEDCAFVATCEYPEDRFVCSRKNTNELCSP